MQTKYTDKKPDESDAVSEVNHRHDNSVANLQRAPVNIIMKKQGAPIYKLSRSKAPKHRKFRLTDAQEKPADLFAAQHGVDTTN